jgi:hypothetical protein
MVDYMLFTEVTALRQEVERIREQRDKALQERDQARREVCELVVYNSRNYHDGEEKECAKDRGWDCYKSEETP